MDNIFKTLLLKFLILEKEMKVDSRGVEIDSKTKEEILEGIIEDYDLWEEWQNYVMDWVKLNLRIEI